MEIKIKGIAFQVTLFCEDTAVDIPKIKHKALRAILNERRIFNEINKNHVRYELKTSDILKPLAIIIIGLVLYHFVRHKPNYWQLPSMIFLLIGYFKLYTNLFKLVRFPILDELIKLLPILVLSLLSAFVSQDLMNYLQ